MNANAREWEDRFFVPGPPNGIDPAKLLILQYEIICGGVAAGAGLVAAGKALSSRMVMVNRRNRD